MEDFTYEIEDAKGCGFQVKDIRMVPKLPSIDHESFDVHRLLNWGNARPKGASIDLSHGYEYAVYVKTAWKLCDILFPSLMFTQCKLMRGKLDTIVEPTGFKGEQLAIIMWQKRDLKKRLYTATCDSFDFSGFDPSPWTMLMFFNLDGSHQAKNGQRSIGCPLPAPTPSPTILNPEDQHPPDVNMRPAPRWERKERSPVPESSSTDVPMGDPDEPIFERRQKASRTDHKNRPSRNRSTTR